jgi:hypothetical protein
MNNPGWLLNLIHSLEHVHTMLVLHTWHYLAYAALTFKHGCILLGSVVRCFNALMSNRSLGTRLTF